MPVHCHYCNKWVAADAVLPGPFGVPWCAECREARRAATAGTA